MHERTPHPGGAGLQEACVCSGLQSACFVAEAGELEAEQGVPGFSRLVPSAGDQGAVHGASSTYNAPEVEKAGIHSSI